MKLPLDEILKLVMARTGSSKSARQEIATQLARVEHQLERIADCLEDQASHPGPETDPGQ